MTAAISDRARAYMSAWHSQRPTLAMMGEFSSGKSELLNCLLARRLLPTRVTATDLPAIWITQGTTEAIRGLGFDGRLVPLTTDDLAEGKAMQYLCIRVETSAEILQRVDLIDTPGISDPRMTTEIVEEVARHVDFVIWCSPMNQAWRQSERAFWKSMPKSAKSGSILALTRADLMSDPRDIEKVVRRCIAESSGDFAAVLPVAAPLVALAKAAASGDERTALLQASGLPVFADQLDRSIQLVEAECSSRPRISEPEELKPLPLTPAMRKDHGKSGTKKKSPAPKSAPAARTPAKEGGLSANILQVVQNFPSNGQGLDTISHLLNQVSKDKTITVEHRDVLVRALTVGVVGEMVIGRILTQVQNEIQDFADGPWRDLS